MSDSLVSRIERGHLDGIQVSTLRAVAAVLEVRVELLPRSRAADLDRLINARHAALTEAVAGWLRTFPGWELRPEYSFSVFGERGVIDLVGWHAEARALLESEHKTDIVDSGELFGTLDRRRRLGPTIVQSLGWEPATVSTLLVIGKATRTGAASATWRRRSTPPSRTGFRLCVGTCAIQTTPSVGSCSSQTVALGNLSTASRPFAAFASPPKPKRTRSRTAAGVCARMRAQPARSLDRQPTPHD